MQSNLVSCLALFGLGVTISALPSPQNDAKHQNQPCYEDNPLRALERFTSAANGFCPGFLAADGKGHPPKTLGDFQHWEFYSACSCYEKTASGGTNPTPTGDIVGSTISDIATINDTQMSTTVAAPAAITAAPEKDVSSAAASAVSPSATITSPAVIPSGGNKAAASLEPAEPAESNASNASSVLSTSASTPAGSIKPGSKGKRGIAYNYKSQSSWSGFFKGSPYAVWGSNWDDKRTDALDLSFTYVPTIVVDASLSNSNWLTNIPPLIQSGTTTLFGSNEPDNAGQANLPPASAATVHQKYLQPFAGKAALGTPAVTNGGSPSGLTYLDAFATDCATCTFSFINIHFYLQASDGITPAHFASALKTHLETDLPAVQAKHENLKGLPVVIGEFYLQGASEDDGVEMLKTVLPYLDAREEVLAYQAFGGLFEGNWINDDGTGLTDAGQVYNTFSAPVAEASGT